MFYLTLKFDVTYLDGVMETIPEEPDARDADIQSLTERVERVELRTRINNVEITNFPVTQNENLVEVVKVLAWRVEIDIRDEDIISVHRVPRYDKQGMNIVVHFVSKYKKNMLLRACSDYRRANGNRISAKALNSALPDVHVYVQEHLSPKKKVLLRQTKQRVRELGYQCTFTIDGNIYVRRRYEDRETILIASQADLLKLA